MTAVAEPPAGRGGGLRGWILRLLARPEVAAKWELDARNLEQCRTLAAEASIHWGRDADHRKALDLPEVEDFTWRRGTDRLLLALASEHGWQGVVPAGAATSEVQGYAAICWYYLEDGYGNWVYWEDYC